MASRVCSSRSSLGLAIATALVAVGCASDPGASGWTQWSGAGANGHWYKVDAKRTEWESAQSAASSSGHYLATITSEAEQKFIVTTFLQGEREKQVFWIGGTCKADGDTWKWVTGESFGYENWKGWEPSGDGDYLCINWNAVRDDPQGEWNDAPNAGTKGYDSGANDGPYASLLESDRTP